VAAQGPISLKLQLFILFLIQPSLPPNPLKAQPRKHHAVNGKIREVVTWGFKPHTTRLTTTQPLLTFLKATASFFLRSIWVYGFAGIR
jgi:hypothetical protein